MTWLAASAGNVYAACVTYALRGRLRTRPAVVIQGEPDERREGGKKIRYLSAPDVVVADSSKVFLQDEVDENTLPGSVVGQQKNTQETYRGTTRKMPNAYDS